MSEYIKKVFRETADIDSFMRVDDSHILDLYLGMDQMSRNTLLLIACDEPAQIYSSQIIAVQIGLRTDGKWALSFSLSNEKYEDLFCHFCSDIIEASRILTDRRQGAAFICSRYVKWQEMLKKNASGLLSFPEIKGLTGELYFLSHFLINEYGWQDALNSWIGPEKADQDFVCPDKWYEVKASVSGAENIRISSVEQLDVDRTGELVLIHLDKTSYADPQKITLNALVKYTESLLPTAEAREKLFEVLLNQGYYFRSEYDEYIFRFSSMSRYLVDANFPSIRRASLPDAVTAATYNLSVADIKEYLVEE